MTDRTTLHGLQVAPALQRFIDEQVLPGTGVESAAFWRGFDAIVTGMAADGLWVRLLAPPAEGKLVNGPRTLKLGDKVRVRLVSTNVEHGFIDFELG